MLVKLLTYNIRHGFHSRDHILQRKRLEAAQRVIASENPDIAALTEACYGSLNSQGITMDYMALFKFRYGFFGGYPVYGRMKGYEGGNVLLSQHPMKAEVVPLINKSAIRAAISLDDNLLNVDVVHPSQAIDDRKKFEALQPLLARRPSPYILTGDFNALSPEDIYDKEQLLEEFQEFMGDTAETVIAELLKSRMIDQILTHGLRDAFEDKKKKDSTVPTRSKYGKSISGMRIDYFFVSNDLKVENAYVLKNEDAEVASDHYPIVGVFHL